MRLLLINPNVTTEITEVMAAEARKSASPGTGIVPVTARFGTLYIENRPEAAIGAHAVLEALAEHGDACDAAIVSAFGDPGLAAARELMDFPIAGLAESALLIAHTLGRRFVIVCLTRRIAAWYREIAGELALAGPLVAVRPIPGPVPDIRTARDDLAEAFLVEALNAVEENQAEVVILGGGPIAGMAREIANKVPVPVIDGVSCAVRLAECLVALEVRAPTRGSFATPQPKPAKNLAPALAARIDREQT